MSDHSAVTVGQLKAALATIDDSVSVKVIYDCGCAEGDVIEVRKDGGQIAMVVESVPRD